MNQNLKVSLDRAGELIGELRNEYDSSLKERQVSARALQLTHEVCERLRSVLDRVARRYWEQHISPQLADEDQKAAAVYFPIAADQNAFDAILGRWRWRSVRPQQQSVYEYLLKLQPFHNRGQKWLVVLNDLAVKGKHIDFVPQKRFEDRRITVTGPGGSMSWGSGVTFGSGVSVMGAPVDPGTQRIVPTPGVTERIEIWVGFMISGHNINALVFCQEALQGTCRIAEDMSDMFGLS